MGIKVAPTYATPSSDTQGWCRSLHRCSERNHPWVSEDDATLILAYSETILYERLLKVDKTVGVANYVKEKKTEKVRERRLFYIFEPSSSWFDQVWENIICYIKTLL